MNPNIGNAALKQPEAGEQSLAFPQQVFDVHFISS